MAGDRLDCLDRLERLYRLDWLDRLERLNRMDPPQGNTDGLVIRDHPRYTGLKQDRRTEVFIQNTIVILYSSMSMQYTSTVEYFIIHWAQAGPAGGSIHTLYIHYTAYTISCIIYTIIMYTLSYRIHECTVYTTHTLYYSPGSNRTGGRRYAYSVYTLYFIHY